MELKVNEFQLPAPILFNYEELKQELEQKVSEYASLVYSDEQIKEAKADVAKLRKLTKSLNDERIRLEREFNKPFEDFKGKIKELVQITDKAISNIDKQVKEFERMEQEKKKQLIKEEWEKLDSVPDWLMFEKIFDKQWLNKSMSMAKIKVCMEMILQTTEKDVATLSKLPEFSFEAIEVYKTTRDLSKAIMEGQRLADIQRRKQEQQQAEEQKRLQLEREARSREEAQRKEPVFIEVEEVKPENEEPEQKAWVSFKAHLSTKDALKLRTFFDENEIEFLPL